MNFPLKFIFKLFAFSPQIYVTDATDAKVMYIKQKLFSLRDNISVFSDETQAQKVAAINADRIVDWSARFQITDGAGQALGAIGRKGFRSIWRAHYDIFAADGQPAGSVTEENPFAKVMDGMLAEIPFVGILSAYVFKPRYLMTGASGTPLLRLKKQPSLVGRRFEVEQITPTSEEETRRNVLALLMLVLLERRRG